MSKGEKVVPALGFVYDIATRTTATDAKNEIVSDSTMTVTFEHEGRGVHRVIGVRIKDHTKDDCEQIFGLIFRGWQCTTCGVFVSEEKEILARCRSCEAPRPTFLHEAASNAAPVPLPESVIGRPESVIGRRVKVVRSKFGDSNIGATGVIDAVCRDQMFGIMYGVNGPMYGVNDDQLYYVTPDEIEFLPS